MGIVVNAVNEAASLGRAGLTGVEGVFGSVAQKLDSSALANLEVGLKSSPIIGEFRDVQEGMAQGDLRKVSANAGVLLLALSQVGGGVSLGGFKQANIL